MTTAPNACRGESGLTVNGRLYLLRPTFACLVAAEEEIGPLFALVERAGDGRLKITELAALFWHCLESRDGLDRNEVENAVLAIGLAGCAKPLRALLSQILQGAG